MDNKSILDQIITNQQAEEVTKLDAAEIIVSLFGELNDRERDVLSRRFGLHGQEKQTLEKIGQVHSLTRERIRQIEFTGVKKLRQLEHLENHINVLKRVINNLLEEHGGFMEREYLLSSLVGFSVGDTKNKQESCLMHKSHLDFLISQLLKENFEEVVNSKIFKNIYKLRYQSLDHLEALAEELLEEIKKTRKVFATEELINLAKDMASFKEHETKYQEVPNNLNITAIHGADLAKENLEMVNKNKVLFSLLKSSRTIEQNKFGHWGASNSREIKPKTINDKIYLILRNHGKPMHFAQIAEEINKLNFDKKNANTATVHNELILDGKYILVGRGLYGLKEWGYQKGTVIDIIERILKEDGPLSREQIINKVLEQRLVKKATINLALMNRQKFERIEGGKYSLKA